MTSFEVHLSFTSINVFISTRVPLVLYPLLMLFYTLLVLIVAGRWVCLFLVASLPLAIC